MNAPTWRQRPRSHRSVWDRPGLAAALVLCGAAGLVAGLAAAGLWGLGAMPGPQSEPRPARLVLAINTTAEQAEFWIMFDYQGRYRGQAGEYPQPLPAGWTALPMRRVAAP